MAAAVISGHPSVCAGRASRAAGSTVAAAATVGERRPVVAATR
jgi:hypothetical protein